MLSVLSVQLLNGRIGFYDGDSWIQLEEEQGVYQIEHRVSEHSSLVVTVWSTLEKESEVFTYRYRVFEDIAAIENEESGGCRGQRQTRVLRLPLVYLVFCSFSLPVDESETSVDLL